ncbi:hypothetical protein P3378_23140, partial [Vibrio parahaemolyticus]|nr:hypothetical protein [Vibrio parahaemolyticus]
PVPKRKGEQFLNCGLVWGLAPKSVEPARPSPYDDAKTRLFELVQKGRHFSRSIGAWSRGARRILL